MGSSKSKTLNLCELRYVEQRLKLDLKMDAEPHHHDIGADLQSPPAEFRHALRVAADVL